MQSKVLNTIQKTWLLMFVAICFVFIFGYLYRSAEHFEYPLRVAAAYLVLSVLIQIVFWLLAGDIWRHIVAVTAGARLTILGSLAQLFTMSLGKYLPGKVWGMLARGILMRHQGISTDSVVIATFFEQFLMLQASLVLSLLLFAFLFYGPLSWLAVFAAIGVVVFGPRLRIFAIAAYVKISAWLGRGAICVNKITMGQNDQRALLLKFIFLWILNGLVLASLYFTFFESSYSSRLLATLIFANTVGITVGFLAIFAPGGIGVREGITSAILVNQMPLADAVLLSLLYRLWVVVVELAGGLLSLWAARALLLRKNNSL